MTAPVRGQRSQHRSEVRCERRRVHDLRGRRRVVAVRAVPATVAEPVGMSAATIGSSAPARDDAPAGAYRNPD